MTPLLSVRDLRVRAGTKTLVNSVDFTLNAGATLGIVGESGSGKTLTARAVLAVLPDGLTASGDIDFDGASLIGRTERELRPLRGTRMSMVMQDPFTALNPLQTVGEHIRESLGPRTRRDRSAARTEVARRLAEVGLDGAEVAGKYPFQLSGGMRQRVAIAAALAGDPDLLVADEPTTALDATTQAEILRLLERLQRDRGMALVLITHDLRIAFSVCDRVMVMYAGSVMEDAPSGDLSTLPRHPYTRGLLEAEPPVTHVVEKLTFIPGSVPRADDVADQCAFADRCAWQAPQCIDSRPPLKRMDGGRLSACVRLSDIGAELKMPNRPRPPTKGAASNVPSGKAIVKVSDLTMTYRTTSLLSRAKEKQAVKGVSFEIAKGESLGLLGETGSGKTTIARCLLGLQRAEVGTMSVADLDITNRRRLASAQRHTASRLVQAVFQDPYASLNPMLTIGSALKEAVAAGGTDQKVEDLLDMVGLPASYATRRPGALSGGQRQRVAIARAVAVRPQVLICDEPVAALDVSVQAQVLEVLRQIRREQGTSMLFITHDLSVVRQMTDRAIVLRNGEIVECGPTDTLLDSPQHPYTISLVGSMPGAAVALP